MIPETKAKIEREAIQFAEENEDVITNIRSYRTGNDLWKGYEAGATPYAEKWEAAEQENKRMREALEELRFNNRQGDPNSYHAIKRILDEALKLKQ